MSPCYVARKRLATFFDGTASLLGPLKHFRLGRQLALLVLVTALPLLLSMYLMFQRLAVNEREGIRQSLMVNAKTLASLVDNEIDTHTAIAATLANSIALQNGDLATFRQQAIQSLGFVPGSWLALADTNGQMVVNTLVPFGDPLPKHIDPEISKRAFSSRRPQVSDLVLGPASKRLTAYVEVPIFRRDAPFYTISIAIPPARFLALIDHRFSRGELVAVLDRGKRFIARVPDHETRVGTLASEGWRAGIAKAAEGWTENRTLDGDLALNAYTATAHGWTVGVSQLESAIASPLQGILLSTAVVAGVLTLLSLGLATLLARHASQGITALASAADDLGQGKGVSNTDAPFAEAAIIGASLEKASAELQRRAEQIAIANATLEARVRERTAELAAEMLRRESSEAQVRQMQKMQAIGQLSGGIAHDFNNMLAIILGGLGLLERSLARGETDVMKFTEGIRQGAQRAAVLTQRLLAFARQQPLAPEITDANKLIGSMSDLFRRTIPENIAIETVLAGGLWRIHADHNQLENALLNLVTNARDAMPNGGKLTIETANAHLDDAYADSHPEVSAGQYVLIAITDTGTGMPADIVDKVFEPFFTTKPTGQGTGLGLAQVYGYVKQSGGHVKIYNEPGHGVTVKLYLPRYHGTDDAVEPVKNRVELPLARHQELILVVEDDPAVLDLTVGMLRELGYRTLAAAGAPRALELLANEPEIKLLLTDVVMPGMNGRTLADAAKVTRPDLKVLYATGYTRNAVVHNGVVDAGVDLLTKPFTLEALAQKIDRMLRA